MPSINRGIRFHVVQLFTKALDEVRRAEARHSKLPTALRWAILKRADGRLHRSCKPQPWPNFEASDLFTAYRLAHQGKAELGSPSAIRSGCPLAHHQLPAPRQRNPRSRSDASIRSARPSPPSRPTASGSCSAGRHLHSNARLEGLNGLFQAARARARGYRNVTTFATMIYMIAAPLGDYSDIHLKHRRTVETQAQVRQAAKQFCYARHDARRC